MSNKMNMKKNSILIVHDTCNDRYSGMAAAIESSLMHYNHEIITLPYSYGITIARIKGNEENGIVTSTWRTKG